MHLLKWIFLTIHCLPVFNINEVQGFFVIAYSYVIHLFKSKTLLSRMIGYGWQVGCIGSEWSENPFTCHIRWELGTVVYASSKTAFIDSHQPLQQGCRGHLFRRLLEKHIYTGAHLLAFSFSSTVELFQTNLAKWPAWMRIHAVLIFRENASFPSGYVYYWSYRSCAQGFIPAYFSFFYLPSFFLRARPQKWMMHISPWCASPFIFLWWLLANVCKFLDNSNHPEGSCSWSSYPFLTAVHLKW